MEAEANARINGLTSTAGPDASSIAFLQARAHRLIENERAYGEREAFIDRVSWERRHTPDGGYPNALPPAPEPGMENREDGESERLRHVRASREREIERLHQVRRDLRRLGRRRPAPTPPYTEPDIAFIAHTGRLYRDSPVPSSLTPARSPVRLSPPDGETEVSSVRNSGPEEPLAAPNLTAARARYRELRDEVSTTKFFPASRHCVFSFKNLWTCC